MEHIEHLMGLYEEGLDELMDAQKYVKKISKAANDDEKSMYKVLARQELDHAQMIIKDGDRLIERPDVHDMVKSVWQHLRTHLLDWHSDLYKKVTS